MVGARRASCKAAIVLFECLSNTDLSKAYLGITDFNNRLRLQHD